MQSRPKFKMNKPKPQRHPLATAWFLLLFIINALAIGFFLFRYFQPMIIRGPQWQAWGCAIPLALNFAALGEMFSLHKAGFTLFSICMALIVIMSVLVFGSNSILYVVGSMLIFIITYFILQLGSPSGWEQMKKS